MSNLQIWSRRTRKPRSSQFSLDEVYIENSGSIKHKKGSLKCTTCIDSDHANAHYYNNLLFSRRLSLLTFLVS